MKEVTVIIPYLRDHLIEGCVKAAIKNAGIPCDQFQVIAKRSDTLSHGLPEREDNILRIVEAVNRIIEGSESRCVLSICDDQIPQPGYLKYALEAMETLPGGWGAVYCTDPDGLMGPVLIDRRMITEFLNGYFLHPGYTHCCSDLELYERLTASGRFVKAPKSVIVHNCCFADNTIEKDWVHERSYDPVRRATDHVLLNKRRAQEWGKYPDRKPVPKICIGLPTSGITKTDTTGCLMDLAVAIKEKYGSYKKIIACGTVEQARNLIVDEFLKTDCTHLLFVDWDATFPEKSGEVLENADKPIIGCNAAKKRSGDPVVERNIEGEPLNYIKHDIEQTDFVGMHVTMIQREVFGKMPWPWFEQTVIKEKRVVVGEDLSFCRKAHKVYESEVWVHNRLSMEVGHIAEEVKTLIPHIKKQIEDTKKDVYINELRKLKEGLK